MGLRLRAHCDDQSRDGAALDHPSARFLVELVLHGGSRAIAALVERGCRTLRVLHIHDATDDDVEHLARSRFVQQLESLGLRRGKLTDTAARAIADHADAFRKLRSLDVAINYLTDAGIADVRRVVPHADVSDQDPEQYGDY